MWQEKNPQVPNAQTTTAQGINSSSDVVGYYADSGGAVHGFLLHKGIFSVIDEPDGALTFPSAINTRGDIVGAYVVAGTEHGFILHQGVFTTIDFPGADVTVAFGLNSEGDIVGFYVSGGSAHGFVLRRGTFIAVDHPNAIGDTYALGINSIGEIVGGFANLGFLAR